MSYALNTLCTIWRPALLAALLLPCTSPAQDAEPAEPTEQEVITVIILDDGGQMQEAQTVVLDPMNENPEFAAKDPNVLLESTHSYESGVKITASTTHIQWEGEGRPIALMDGDMQTRWSSAYADDQRITIDLGQMVDIAALRLHWETATPKHYRVAASDQGRAWRTVRRFRDGKEGPRIDELKVGKARWLRLDLQERATEWGFSLWEIRVLTPDELAAETAAASAEGETAAADAAAQD